MLDHAAAAFHEASCKTASAPAERMTFILAGGRNAFGRNLDCFELSCTWCNDLQKRRLPTEPTLVSEQRGTNKVSFTQTFRFNRYIKGDFSDIMSRISSKSKAARGVGFLGMVTLHKAAAIAERAHHKPDKEAHEVKFNYGVCSCEIPLVHAHHRLNSCEARPDNLNLGVSDAATSVPTEGKRVCREQ